MAPRVMPDTADRSKASGAQRIRILHISYPLIRAGIETWLLNVLKHIDRTRYEMHVATHRVGCDLDEEYKAMGATIHPIPRADKPLAHFLGIKRLLRSPAPYDIVHSHVHHSGLELLICRALGYRSLIVHAHNDEGAFRNARPAERLILRVTHPWMRILAKRGLACSRAAASAFFGKAWEKDPRFRVLHYGIDLRRFEACHTLSAHLREQLGLRPEMQIIGHVGRFAPQKNHSFIVSLAKLVIAKLPQAVFLFIGDGPLRPEIENHVRAAGLQSHVRFLGSRPDVPELLAGVFDVLLFPSLHEGLPVTLLEAQAAACPTICSDRITEEVAIISELFTRLSLNASPLDWLEAIRNRLTSRRPSMEECLARLAKTDFEIGRGVQILSDLYEELANHDGLPR